MWDTHSPGLCRQGAAAAAAEFHVEGPPALGAVLYQGFFNWLLLLAFFFFYLHCIRMSIDATAAIAAATAGSMTITLCRAMVTS